MKFIMMFNALCIAWLALCYYQDWEFLMNLGIIAPNMVAWTVVVWLTE